VSYSLHVYTKELYGFDHVVRLVDEDAKLNSF
jgi:hypothetical protein